jgi:hypothetical protein
MMHSTIAHRWWRIANAFWRSHWAVAVLCLSTGFLAIRSARSDEQGELKTDAEQTKASREKQLEVMRRYAMSLTVKVEAAGAFVDAEIIKFPLLHYYNPGGETLDATLWAWSRRGRPLVLASISREKSDANIEKWSCELLSLADERVVLDAKPGWKWAPPTSGIEWKPVADAPAPGETPVLRSRQMSEVARRFSARGVYRDGEEIIELRLMDRPLSRFSDPEHGLIDGAFYAFAGGTNPEVLLIVECRQESGAKPAWFHGFARLGAGRLTARLGETVVWERPEIKRWNPAEPYFSTFGPVDSVFGSDSTEP